MGSCICKCRCRKEDTVTETRYKQNCAAWPQVMDEECELQECRSCGQWLAPYEMHKHRSSHLYPALPEDIKLLIFEELDIADIINVAVAFPCMGEFADQYLYRVHNRNLNLNNISMMVSDDELVGMDLGQKFIGILLST